MPCLMLLRAIERDVTILSILMSLRAQCGNLLDKIIMHLFL